MIDEVMLKEALVTSYDRECNVLEERASISGMHTFPQDYYYRMRKISKMAGRRYVTVMHRRVRLALVVAVLIAVMIAATVTTIAIIRPQIFYTIKKGVKSWDYTFRQEDPDKLAGEFVCKKPEVPEEYSIYDEQFAEQLGSYVVDFEDNHGHFINYEQEDMSKQYDISLTDTFTEEKEVLINGYKGKLLSEDDMHYILWNDGYYVYFLGGNCPEDVVIKMAESVK